MTIELKCVALSAPVSGGAAVAETIREVRQLLPEATLLVSPELGQALLTNVMGVCSPLKSDAAWMANADVLLVPDFVGDVREQILQAMGCGVPVVAMEGPETRDACGMAGLFVPRHLGLSGLVQAARELCQDSSEREAAVRRGRAQAQRVMRRREAAATPTHRAETRCISATGANSLLILRDGGLGDLLMMTPALAELRRTRPEQRIVVACLPRFMPLFDGLGLVDELVDIGGREARIEGEGFGKVLDLRYGLERHPEALRRHRVELWGELLDAEPPRGFRRCLYRVSPEERRAATDRLTAVRRDTHGVIAIQARSSSPVRWYPYWRELACELAERGWGVALLHDERLEGPSGSRIANCTGQLTLRETAAVLAGCQALVGPDSGLYHLAGAVGTPVVGLFNEARPELRRPLDGVRSVHFFAAELCPLGKMPCAYGTFPECAEVPCLRHGVSDVADAAIALARKRSRSPAITKKPRVALVTTCKRLDPSRGGAEVQAVRTAEELRRLGWDVRLQTSEETLPKADLYHLMRWESEPAGTHLGERLRAAGLPVLFTPIYWDPAELWHERARLGLCSREEGEAAIDTWRAWLRYWAGVSTCLAANGWGELAAVRALSGNWHKPGWVIPNGAETSFGTDPGQRWDPEGYLLCLGRIELRKNQLHLVEAAAGVPGRTLRLVGRETDPEYAALVRQAAQRHGVRVSFEAGVPREQVPELIAGAAVVCQPSWYETPGLCALEALALGRPVVTGNRALEREVFGDLAHACDPASPNSIAAVIEAAITSGPPPPEIVGRLLQSFTWENAAKTTAAIYSELLDG